MARLAKAAGDKATVVAATKGIAPRKSAEAGHDHGNTDPHAWQSVANAKVYVANIRDALIAADPASARRPTAPMRTAYTGQARCAGARGARRAGQAPADRRKVITTHDAFGYFAAAYGIAFIAPRGRFDRIRGHAPGTSRPSSARSERRRFRRFFWKM